MDILSYPNIVGLDIGYVLLFVFIGLFVASLGSYKAFKKQTAPWWIASFSGWILGIASLAIALYIVVSGLQLGWVNVESADVVLSLIVIVYIIIEAMGMNNKCGCKGD